MFFTLIMMLLMKQDMRPKVRRFFSIGEVRSPRRVRKSMKFRHALPTGFPVRFHCSRQE